MKSGNILRTTLKNLWFFERSDIFGSQVWYRSDFLWELGPLLGLILSKIGSSRDVMALQKPSLINLVCTSPRHKIQDNCSPRIQAMVVQRGYPSKDFWSIHVQTLITQAWNGVSWKFKNLKLTFWSALALWPGSRSIPPSWTYLLTLITPLLHSGGSYSEKLFWHVANTIDSLNASIPSNH